MPKMPGKSSSKANNDTVIVEGEAVEKDAEASPNAEPMNKGKQSKQTSQRAQTGQGAQTSQRAKTGKRGQSSSGISMIIIILALVAAIGAGGYYLYTERNVAAPASNVDQTTPIKAGDLDELTSKLGAQAAQIADLQQQLASLASAHEMLAENVAQIPSYNPSDIPSDAPSNAPSDDITDGLISELTALNNRLSALEANPVSPVSPANPTNPTNPQGQSSAIAMDNDLVLAQMQVIVLGTVMAENRAGGALDSFVPVIDGLATSADLAAQWGALRPAFITTPPSRNAIINAAEPLVGAMVDYVNDQQGVNGEGDKTIVAQAMSELGKLVQLRKIDQTKTGIAGHLARFEAALVAGDLAGAVTLVETWPGPAIVGMGDWQASAQNRLDLDAGVITALGDAINRLNVNLERTNATRNDGSNGSVN